VIVQSLRSTAPSLSASRMAEIKAILAQREAIAEAPTAVAEAAGADTEAPTGVLELLD
jgi:hypothetical protein